MSALAPQLATNFDLREAGRLVMDDEWVMEQKLDGHRIMLVGPGTAAPAAITRNGTTYTRQLPAAIRKFRIDQSLHNTANLVLDGELVGDTYWVFDIQVTGTELDGVELTRRRELLEQFCEVFRWPDAPFRLVPQARTADEKEALLLQAAGENLEGIVAKHRQSGYHAGRTQRWAKLKFVQTADVVVIAVRDDGKESASLGITLDGGATFDAVGRCSLIGKPAVTVGDVVEVRYLYVPDRAAPRLYQPTLVRIRDDKTAGECDGSDFKYTNKTVLETL